MKYRKKPVVIEATQWRQQGDHPEVKPHGAGEYDPLSLVTCGACKQEMFWKSSMGGGVGVMHFTHGEIKTLESKAGSAHLVWRNRR